MQLTKLTPTTYKITLHSYELATLISAARWIADGAHGTLSKEVIEQMEQMLERYDHALEHLKNTEKSNV